MVGLVLLLAGLGCLGYVGYQLWGTNISAHKAYDHERAKLKQSWSSPGAPTPSDEPARQHGHVVPGDAIGLISIPAIGVDRVPILQGVGLDVLAGGVGHYPKTAGPGQIGNFALAGHRITHGEPFANLLRLKPGDRVVIETRTAVYTYQIDDAPKSLTVQDTAGWVLDPVPGHPTEQPTRKLITLTTCQDLFHSPDRSVGFGHLVSARRK